MMQTYVGFIDVGFLRAAGAAVLGQRAASVNPNSNAVANWFRRHWRDAPTLRANPLARLLVRRSF